MPAGEIHLQLAVNFPSNRKVRSLGVRYGRDVRALRDLYVQMCLHAKANLSDGFVADGEVGLLVYPDTEKNGKRDAERLAEADLIERCDDGWRITGWSDRNSSRDAVKQRSEAKARGARLANHRRWHVEYGNPDQSCQWCIKEGLNSDQTTDESSDQSSDQASESDRLALVKRSDSTETESETESETEVKEPGRQKPAGRPIDTGSDNDPDFAAFWSAYRRKAAKGAARKAWRTAVITKKIDPKVIILAAEQFSDDPATRATETKYIAHPATWLNGECWLDWSEEALAAKDTAAAEAASRARQGYSNSPWDN